MAQHEPGTVERAFQLARSGTCKTLAEIRAQLIKERHVGVSEHLVGPSLRRDLTRLCAEARRGDEPAPG
jgi:hypothetical protein